MYTSPCIPGGFFTCQLYDRIAPRKTLLYRSDAFKQKLIAANVTQIIVVVATEPSFNDELLARCLLAAHDQNLDTLIVLNKCDLPSANIDKVKGQLSQLGLTSEDWGGKTIVVPVSAKTGEGVEHLLEMLLLEAELLELKANSHLRARGVVIEG